MNSISVCFISLTIKGKQTSSNVGVCIVPFSMSDKLLISNVLKSTWLEIILCKLKKNTFSFYYIYNVYIYKLYIYTIKIVCFQWWIRCLRNPTSWKVLWLCLAGILQQAWKGETTGKLNYKKSRWVNAYRIFADVFYYLIFCADATIFTLRTTTRRYQFRKYPLEKCQEQLLYH